MLQRRPMCVGFLRALDVPASRRAGALAILCLFETRPRPLFALPIIALIFEHARPVRRPEVIALALTRTGCGVIGQCDTCKQATTGHGHPADRSHEGVLSSGNCRRGKGRNGGAFAAAIH